MSYTLYTDVISTRYKELADNVREKIIALNEFTNINEYLCVVIIFVLYVVILSFPLIVLKVHFYLCTILYFIIMFLIMYLAGV